MILDHPASHYVFVFHPDAMRGKKYTVYRGKELTNAQALEYWGKWIVLGEKARLDVLAMRLDPYVEAGGIPCVKYDREPPANLGVEECVMMVYCDRRQRDEVWEILKRYKVKMKAWVTERETMELWMPGAPLLERWMDSKGLDEQARRAVREDARKRLEHIFNNPDETFSPWEQ